MSSSKKKNKKRKQKEFSKKLLIQESALIWIMTLALVTLSFICVLTGAYAELPWLTAMVALPWGAYGVSQAYYYKKAEKENVLKISQNPNKDDVEKDEQDHSTLG